ncbi:protein kinase domain-containing protein [Streptomyces sp. NBC_00589]|uniref:serine/threonine-protein kinase n=1 Tax=Streptomyces sp. NBC_00589 TaxID=2975785 RepID=UPI003FCCE570
MVTGRYRLVESIGQGGMGRVWRAADEMLDRQVAVKEMRIDGLDPEDRRTRRERTLREARATARIDHPNVVRIYDVVDEDERLWIVMELVAGRSLEQIVVEDGPLGPREAARIGLELVAALRQVHAGGVLHRDIKPGNVLVERRGHRVVLTDFGIAALQDAEALTMVGMLVGSPDYMAPERISGRPQGPPSDVWSLGATLCAALGGRSPFSRSTTLATLHAVLYEEPDLPAGAGELRDILAALLEKEPSTRPGLEELEAELGEIAFPVARPAQLPGVGPESEPEPEPEPEAEGAPEPEPEFGPEPGAGPDVGEPVPPPEPSHQAHEIHEIHKAHEAHKESPTPALLDAELIRAVRQPPSDLPEATPPPFPDEQRTRTSDLRRPQPEPEAEPEPQPGREPEPVHDAIPVRPPTRTRKGPPDFEKHPPEQRPLTAPNASTENPSELRAEVGSQIPSAGPPRTTGPGYGAVGAVLGDAPEAFPQAQASAQRSARPETETAAAAQRPTVPGPVVMPRGEFPGPAVPSGPRRGRRRMGLAAAGGVVVAGAVVGLILAATGGSPDDKNGASSSSSGSPSGTASGNTSGSTGGSSSSASPSPTVEGTSRPPSLPPGARREAGGYAWVTPKGWRRDLKTGSEVHYTSPDGRQELVAKSSLAKGDLMQTWQTSEKDARRGQDYQKIRLDNATFKGRPAVVWEYTFTLKGVHWHALLLGFDADGKSYQINTWYQPDIESEALKVYQRVKNSFTVL